MDNRENILYCALDLFYQKGYDAVGVQEICSAAGVTKPTLYHYFGSKYGLLETLLEQELRPFLESVSAVSFQGSIEEALRELATAMIDFAKQNHKAYMLFMSMCYSPKENETYRAASGYIRIVYNQAVQLFEQAANHLGNMNGRQRQFAIGFIGLINHYMLFMEYQEPEGTGVSEETKYRLIHQFLHGVYS